MTTKCRFITHITRAAIHGVVFISLLLLAGCAGSMPASNSAEPGAPAAAGPTLAPTAEVTPEPQPDATATTPAELDIATLGNIAYRGILEEAVMLADGTFEGDPFVAGGASRPVVTLLPEPVAFGDLNGDGQIDAAVVLVSDSGGSGSFVYLAAVESRDGVAENAATLFLGDRVQVNSLAIEDGRLVVKLLSHAPDDPACCPTQEKTLNLTLSGDQLQDAGE